MKTQTIAAPTASLPTFNRFHADIDGPNLILEVRAPDSERHGHTIQGRLLESVDTTFAEYATRGDLIERTPEPMRSRLLARKEVSEPALFARLKRRLGRDGKKFHKTDRRSRWLSTLGDYYIDSARSRLLQQTHVDIAALAGELGVLRPGETLAEGGAA